ncbi:hypothetical protein [Actinomadura madurae]|uniref:hypothetical protein n=1 Tax=Actinomadura madurae TaxID=1993 RepID=UPI003D6C1F49
MASSSRAAAFTLASLSRVAAAHHRPPPEDSELVQPIAVLAHPRQDAIWNRQQLANQIPSPPASSSRPRSRPSRSSRHARTEAITLLGAVSVAPGAVGPLAGGVVGDPPHLRK